MKKTISMQMFYHVAAFGCAGGVAFLVDAGLLLLLAKLGIPVLAARLCSINVAMVVAWWMNRTFTFKKKSLPTWKEFKIYVALSWSVAALNYGLFSVIVLVHVIDSPFWAVAVATSVSMLASYLGMLKVFV